MNSTNEFNEFASALISKERSPLIPAEDDYFSPVIGEWDFKRTEIGKDGQRYEVDGEWIFSWVLEGKMIQDIFIWPPRSQRDSSKWDGEYGTTVRCYNHETHHWEIVYLNGGYVGQLEAIREDDKIVLSSKSDPNVHWVFSNMKENSFQWDSLTRNKDGVWESVERLLLTRKK